MSAVATRLDELRRRVDKDPASIAFAPLAEELRRIGQHDEAVRVCRAGLEHHPTYLSAHVTLGRTLLEMRRYPEARAELEYVLQAAPDNLLALKCMTELRQVTEEGVSDKQTVSTLTPAQTGASIPPVQTPAAEALAIPSPTRDPVLEELEAWHARIQADRAARSGGIAPQGLAR